MKRHLLSALAIWVMILLAFGSVDNTSTNTGGSGIRTGETFHFSQDVFAGRTQHDEARITQLSVAKDETGLRQMQGEGRLMIVPAGTEARLIQGGVLRSEIRITSGPLAGRAVWVASDFVRK